MCTYHIFYIYALKTKGIIQRKCCSVESGKVTKMTLKMTVWYLTQRKKRSTIVKSDSEVFNGEEGGGGVEEVHCAERLDTVIL